MFKNIKFKFIFIFFLSISPLFADQIKQIEINGNDRVSDETILMFSRVNVNDDINDLRLNDILKNLYNSNFFENVSVKFLDQKLQIEVVEYPIIQNIEYKGIKAEKIREPVLSQLSLKTRSSYDEILLKKDKKKILSKLKDLGYYFSSVDVLIEEIEDNKVNIYFDIDLGKKAKIKKISFIGNKIFKDSKLKNIIVSEEYKFWKFISGKKFLNQNLIQLDNRLLKNFYLNKGYYNAQINSSFAKIVNDDEFELIFNVNANEKIFFNNLELVLPTDYDQTNFTNLRDALNNYEGEHYSINAIEKILDEIDEVSINEQYQTIKASVSEKIDNNKIDIKFIIEETDKFLVQRINIFGNNVTRENVIRNQFEIDEGDIYNDILQTRSINNLKSLNFFKNVSSEVLTDEVTNDKIINVTVEEKATGEITAGAGVGTSGGSFAFGVKENNFLGKGIGLSTNLTVTAESVKGQFSVTNPNFLDSDKSVSFNIESTEYDNLKDFGYKTNKTGFSISTNFEYYDDFFLGIGSSNFYEKIETDSTASARQKTQEGDYYDSFLMLKFNLDKRNQKFQTSKGYRSYYALDLPLVSKTNTLKNTYNYNFYKELYDQNISNISLYLQNSFSLSGDDIKLSERLYIPSAKLRGFERGKVGPKDGNDYIGGNYLTTLNISTTLPQILENSQNTDFLFFMDVANIWGVDYDSSIDNSNTIRSSIGVGLDWFTPIGPLNFSFAHPITKASGDKTETFRFNLGTTF
jgi:outer membrane protein insertion porin family